jgi:diguanylate cyclase (GGDEF)-like protein
MALNSAFCFLAVAVAVVLSRPHGRLLAVATTTAPGGMMARRFFPVVLLLPLMLGWLRLEASDAGLFDDRVGTWWLTAATIAAMGLLLWRGAIELNTADVDRRDLEDRLSELANYDQMTGLFTRHRFHEEVARHSALARRQGGSVTLIVLDLDRLKQVNDKLGHAAGDALIRGVAAAIASRVRATDLAGRLGGDEFGVLLVETTPEGALGVAQDLLVAIRAARPESTDVEAWSTASVGLALSSGAPSDDGGALLALADEAMYEAKRAGGDRTAHAWAGGVRGSAEVAVAAAVAPSRQAMGV